MTGIYYIKCKINKKVYIGSSKNMLRRLTKHFYELRKGKHANEHLQNTFNKYGEDTFKFGVIEYCKKDLLLEREQYYIDNNNRLINIIKVDINRPTLDKEVVEKIRSKINEMYKKGELPRYNKGSFKKGQKPWNTGKKYKSTDHLKVPKRNKGDRSNDRETKRNKLPEIEVYDINMNFLGKWRSSKDLQEDSTKSDFILIPHMILRNQNGRQGYNPYLLQSVNINKSNKFNKPYKSLFFKKLS